MMRKLRRGALLAALCSVMALSVRAQSQMLLPYNDMLFQASWENPAVRPMHRFSFGLPVLSSIEAGAINNGFQLSKVSEVDANGWMNIDLAQIVDGLKEGKGYQQYAETQIDLLHFRMKWRDWFFWFGMRNVTAQTFGYQRELFELVYGGNGTYVGKEMSMDKVSLDLKNYHELTFGFSKEIGSQWMVGFRASFLSGLASGVASFDKFTLAVSGDPATKYAHTLDMSGLASASSLHRFQSDEQLKNPKTWFNVKNLGFALAGGVSYRPIPHLNLSLAFSDVGMIDWNDSVQSYKALNKKMEINELVRGPITLFKDSLQNLGQRIQDQLATFSKDMEPGARYTQWLAPKFHFLATYEVARQTVVGASFSGIYQAKQFYPSATISFMQGVADIFQLQVAWSYNQHSPLNVGAGMVICPGPVQFYVVTDNFLAFIDPKLAKATNVRVGINLVFERLNGHHMLTHDR